MKILILILNVLGFWLIADAAHAEPISLAIAAISQFVGSLSVIGKLVLTVALNVGLSLIEKALAKKEQPRQAGAKLEISMGDDHPMSFVMGSYATAGRRKYAGSWGDDGKTPNAYFTDVIEIGSLPNHAGERGLTSVWIDDQEVGVLWEEPHPDGRGYPVLQYRVGRKDYLWIRFLDGTQSGPDAFLTAKFGTEPDRPWKSTMIGLGCQVVILTARYNTDLFSGIPAGLYQPHPVPLYDIRKDSSAGGNGAHRWDNRATWEPTSNPATMIYNLARGVYHGSEWVYGGQNIAAFSLPAANWMAAANACDAAVTLDDGRKEPAFRAGYEVQCDQQPLDVISELLKGCNGRMAEVGGVFKMLISTPGGAVYSFSDDDIVVTEEQDFQPFPSLSDTYNAIEATYPEPGEKWATKDAPGRYNADLEILDGNRRLPAQIQFPAVPFANQVQRVGLAMIQDYRRFRVHQISLPPDAYPLEPNDVVSWTSERNGYAEKKFLVVKVEPQANFLTVVTLKEVDPADYDWHSGLQLPTAIGWIGPITPPSQPMVGWTVEPGTVKDAGGIDRRPAIRISCAPDMDDVEHVWVQVRLKETGDVVFDSDSTRYESPFSWLISGQWTLPNTDYEARGRYLPKSNRPTDWSAWLTVKTPNVLIASGDVFDNAIIASKIADAAVTAEKIMDEAVTNLKLADAAVSTAKLQVEAVTAEVLANNAVVSTKLADAAVTAAKLADGMIDATKLAANIKAVEIVSILPTTGNVDGRQVYLTTDGKLYRYHLGAWTTAVASGDINGTLADAQIQSVAAGKVTGQMTNAQIAAVDAAKVTGALVSSQIADSAITNSKLAALAVDAAKLADGSVGASKLAIAAVDATKFASGIRPVEIISTLPTTGNVEGRMVYLTTDDKLYRYTGSAWTAATAAADIAGQIVGTQISDGAISTPKLTSGSVTANVLAAGAVTADKIAANTITAGQIAAGAIGATQIAANAITADKMVLGDFTNRVENPNFGEGDVSWLKTSTGVVIINDPTNAYIGNYYMSIGVGSGNLTRNNSIFPVVPGEQYFLQVFAKAVGAPNVNLTPRIRFMQADKSTFVAAISTSAFTSADAVYVERSAAITVPAGAVYAWVDLLPGGSVTAGSYAVGFVSCQRRNTGNLLVDGVITTSKLAANAVVAGNLAANAVTAKSLVLQDWENLIPDNQMQSAAAWPTLTSCVITPATAQAFTSKGSIDYTYAAGSSYLTIVVGSPFAVASDQQYFASMQVVRTSGTQMGFWVRVHWLDANGALLTPDTYATIGAANSTANTVDGVQNFSATITPPATAFGARVQIYVQRSLTDSNISFGGLSWLRKASANLLVDGSVVAGKIAAYAVTATAIATGAVTADAIAANAVTAVAINAGSIMTAKIAAGAITTGTIAVGAVTANELAANAVTAGNIAANAVTAGTIASGAISASQIATNAITSDKLASNSVTTNALAVGSGKNLLQNANFAAGMDCWTSGSSGTIPGLLVRIRATTETYAGKNNPTLMVFQNSGPTSGGYYTDVRWVRPDSDTLAVDALKYGVPCTAGEWLEATAYVSAHRCIADLRIEWRAADGSVISYTTASSNSANSSDSANPDNWSRLRTVGAAPASAVCASIHLRKRDTNDDQTNSYMFINKPMLCRIPAGAAEPTPWSNGDVVMITNGGIVANAVTADKIAANAVTAGKIAANAVTAGTIAAGAVTAATIAAGTITGDKLAANTIGADQIAANAITAKSLILTDFSNMADNGWSQGNLDGWTTTGFLNFANDPNQGDASGWRLFSNGVFGAVSKFFPVQPGQQYAFEVWVLNWDPDYGAAVYAVCKGAASDTQTFVQAAATSTKNSWVLLRGRVTIPSGQTRCAMALQIGRPATGGAGAAWSRPAMRRAVSAELIVDGAITANKISANSLDAITANLGAVNISSAVIGSLQVGRSNIVAGAISRVDYSSLAEAGVGTSNTAITGMGVPHGTNTSAVLVHSSFSLSGTAASGQTACKVIISIWDSANNGYTALIPFSFVGFSHFSHEFNFTPPADSGGTSFRFDVRVESGSDVRANNRTIRVLTLYGK
ncbi:phage tail protein [Rhizobium rhizogenes]|uniref:phage tail protein n=1 Tax=Rhizobium rhizogenes TaxID=359 RepID=UPI001F1E12BD|nr:phage tail protein [Rhizobium rhizogenes]